MSEPTRMEYERTHHRAVIVSESSGPSADETPELPSGEGAFPGAIGWVPHKCPVCDGAGLVSRPPWVAGDQYYWSSSQTTFVCPTCNGARVLWAPNT